VISVRPTVVLALLVALCLSACELRLASDVVVDADGSGSFALHLALDPELHELLLDAGLDPLLGMDELRRDAPEWDIEQLEADDGGLELVLRTAFEAPDDFARLTDSLHELVDDQDGQVWDELRIAVDGDRVTFSGAAGLVVPRFPGADGVAFDEEDLAELVRERGEQFVRYELRVTLPGEVVDHDADEVVGSTLVWHLPVGTSRPVAASSELAVATTPLLLTAIALVVATGTAISLVAVRARRAGRRRREARRKVRMTG